MEGSGVALHDFYGLPVTEPMRWDCWACCRVFWVGIKLPLSVILEKTRH